MAGGGRGRGRRCERSRHVWEVVGADIGGGAWEGKGVQQDLRFMCEKGGGRRGEKVDRV